MMPLRSELHGRVPWRWLPLVALLAAAAAYLLHHVPWFAEHDVLVAVGVVLAAAGITVGAGLLARPAERELPRLVAVASGAAALRPASRRDLGFCAALHGEVLGHGFFAALGHDFLRAYYAALIDSPHTRAIVATTCGTPIGFVVGSVDPRAHSRWVLRHRGVRLAARGTAALLLHPRTALRFARTRVTRYRGAWQRSRGDAAPPAPETAPAVLSHVAVVPGVQGLGIGEQLVTAFVDAVAAAGSERVALITLHGPDGAAGFYQRQGWRAEPPHLTADGTRVLTFTFDLQAPERCGAH